MKERMINTRIWSDSWYSNLDPIEKLLFIYLLSNTYTNISGIYEIPLKVVAVETGIDPSMIEKIMPRLANKVLYVEGWVVIPNFPKHQKIGSGDVVKGIMREFNDVPPFIQQAALKGGWGDGLGMVSDTKPNLTKPNLSVTASKDADPLEDDVTIEEDEDVRRYHGFKRVPEDKNARLIMGKVGIKFPTPLKQMKAISTMLKSGYTDVQILDKWEELTQDPFWGQKGVDFGIVLSQIGKSINKDAGRVREF